MRTTRLIPIVILAFLAACFLSGCQTAAQKQADAVSVAAQTSDAVVRQLEDKVRELQNQIDANPAAQKLAQQEQQIAALKAQISAAPSAQDVSDLKAQLNALQTQRAQAATSQQGADAAVNSIDKLTAALAQWTANSQQIHQQAATQPASSDPVTPVVAAIGSAVSLIPGYGTAIAGILGIGAAAYQTYRKSKSDAQAKTATDAATSIVNSIQTANDMGHITITPQAQAIFNAVQTPAAKAIFGGAAIGGRASKLA